MNPGGEAADTLVKIYLSGVEMMIRLSGSALKNMLALSMALAKENKKVSGKINLTKMLRETRDLRTFTMTPAQYKAFKKIAKKQGILFAAVTDKDDKGKVVDVILPATELDRANLLFERILYDPKLGPDSPEPPRHEEEHWWQRLFHRREKEPEREAPPDPEPAPVILNEQERRVQNPTRAVPELLPEYQQERGHDYLMGHPVPLPQTAIPLALPVPQKEVMIEEHTVLEGNSLEDRETKEEKATGERSNQREPVTVVPPQPIPLPEAQTHDGPPRESGEGRQEAVQNDAPLSRPALPDTSAKSFLPSGNADTRTTRANSERPSVLKRLEGYRSQLDSKKGHAPEKGKDTPEKQSGKGRQADRNAAKPKVPVKGSRQVPKPVR